MTVFLMLHSCFVIYFTSAQFVRIHLESGSLYFCLKCLHTQSPMLDPCTFCMCAVYISQGFIRESPTIYSSTYSVYLDSATCSVLPHPNKSFHPPEVRKTERGPSLKSQSTQNSFQLVKRDTPCTTLRFTRIVLLVYRLMKYLISLSTLSDIVTCPTAPGTYAYKLIIY